MTVFNMDMTDKPWVSSQAQKFAELQYAVQLVWGLFFVGIFSYVWMSAPTHITGIPPYAYLMLVAVVLMYAVAPWLEWKKGKDTPESLFRASLSPLFYFGCTGWVYLDFRSDYPLYEFAGGKDVEHLIPLTTVSIGLYFGMVQLFMFAWRCTYNR